MLTMGPPGELGAGECVPMANGGVVLGGGGGVLLVTRARSQ